MKINHLAQIAKYWNHEASQYAADHPEHRDPSRHPSWGLFHIPEADIQLLAPASKSTGRLIELGCGQGHDAIALANDGWHVLAVDVAIEQLRRAPPHPSVTFLHASAENMPVDDNSADAVISDHGAFDHSPAHLLLPEVRRVLCPGGLLVICTYSPLAFSCYSPTSGTIDDRLHVDYPRAQVRYNGQLVGIEYSNSAWINLFRSHGFLIERLEELVAPAGASEHYDDLVSIEWASRWPTDNAWVARLEG